MKNLNNVLIVVIRYFGGIKLGAGPLTRTYSKCVSEAVKKAQITDLINGYYIKISFDYDNIKTIDNILKNYSIEKAYDENVIYSFKIKKEDYEVLESIIIKNAKVIKKEPITFTL